MLEKLFFGSKGCDEDVHIEVAPYNNGKKIVVTILKDEKKVTSYSSNEEPSMSSFDKLEWFFTTNGADCYQTVRTWWLNEAYPKVQRAVTNRNRITTPSKRSEQSFLGHVFRYK